MIMTEEFLQEAKQLAYRIENFRDAQAAVERMIIAATPSKYGDTYILENILDDKEQAEIEALFAQVRDIYAKSVARKLEAAQKEFEAL